MKRNVCTKLTAALLAAILIMPTQWTAYASEYEAADISPEMQTDIKDKFLWTEENELSEDTSVSDEAEAQEMTDAETETEKDTDGVPEESADPETEEVQPDGTADSSDTPADFEGTVTIIHNEGYSVPEPEVFDGLYAIDACEDMENASGEIIPVVGYEITAEEATNEELLGAASYPSEYYPTVSTGISAQGGNLTCWPDERYHGQRQSVGKASSLRILSPQRGYRNSYHGLQMVQHDGILLYAGRCAGGAPRSCG